MSTETTFLEYIGPPGQVMVDEDGKTIELVAGRRYQMTDPLAAYRLEHDVHHWKRPDPPKRETAAAKE